MFCALIIIIRPINAKNKTKQKHTNYEKHKNDIKILEGPVFFELLIKIILKKKKKKISFSGNSLQNAHISSNNIKKKKKKNGIIVA